MSELTDEELIEEWKQDFELQGKTTESIRKYGCCIDVYTRFLEDNGYNILGVDKKILREFTSDLRNERGVKNRTLKFYFSALNSLYEFLSYNDYIDSNIVLSFRKRYLSNYKPERIERPVPDVEKMSKFINSIPKLRDKVINLLFAKTGIRRGELISIDLDDINWEEYSIELKEKPKRSNKIVFFDHETALLIKRWLKVREEYNPKTEALFIGETGERLKRHGVSVAVKKWAKEAGLHDPDSDNSMDKFSPHCYRHWFTTMMGRNGLKREYIQELRGDGHREAIDIYTHIDKKDLRQAYIAAVPELGII